MFKRIGRKKFKSFYLKWWALLFHLIAAQLPLPFSPFPHSAFPSQVIHPWASRPFTLRLWIPSLCWILSCWMPKSSCWDFSWIRLHPFCHVPFMAWTSAWPDSHRDWEWQRGGAGDRQPGANEVGLWTALSSHNLNLLVVENHWRVLARHTGTRQVFNKWSSGCDYS